MKKTIKLILCLTLITSCLQVTAQEKLEDKVKKLLEVTGSKAQFDNVIDQMIDLQKEAYQGVLEDDFFTRFKQRIKETGFKEIHQKIIPVYVKHLTEEEIDGLIEFYESEVGKSYIKKQPLITQESMQIGAEWGGKIGAEIAEELFNEANEVKLKELFDVELEEDCSKFKKGTYKYLLRDDLEIQIARKGNKQVERTGDRIRKIKIKWISNNRYTEIEDGEEEIPDNITIVNIYEITDSSYKYVARVGNEDHYFEGEIFKIK